MEIKPSLKFILAVFLSFCLLSPLYAQVSDELVKYLCEYAQRLYERGDLQGAQHEFRKALMVDPSNATAKSYLKTMGVDTDKEALGAESADKERIRALQKSLDIKNKELADLKRDQEVGRFLSDKTASAQLEKLTSDKEALEISLRAKEKEIAGLNDNLKLEREQLLNKDSMLRTIDNTLQTRDKELTEIKNALKLQKDELARKDIIIQDRDKKIADRENALGAKENQVQALNSQINTQELEKQMIIDSGKSSLNQLVEYKAKLDSMEAVLKAKEKEASGLNEDLKQQREQSVAKDSALQAKDKQIADKESALRARDKELTEIKNALKLQKDESTRKDIIIQARDKQITDKESALRTRDNQVQALNSQINTQELERQMIIDSGKSSLGQLTEYKAKLESMEGALAAKEKEIAGLIENLKAQREQSIGKDSVLREKDGELQAKDSALRAKDQEIARLNEELTGRVKNQESIAKELQDAQAQLGEAGDRLAQTERSTADKDREAGALTGQVRELNSQLRDAKDKIAQAEKAILDKDKELGLLSGRVEELNNQLNGAKDKIVRIETTTLNRDKELGALTKREKELAAQLADTKSKLEQAQSSALEKSNALVSRLIEVKDKLAQAEKLIPDKEKESLGKDKQIKVLEEQLSQLESSYASQLAEGQDKVFKLRNMLLLKDKKLEAAKKKTDADIQAAQLRETMEKMKRSLHADIETYKAKLELANKGIVVTVLTDIIFNSGSAEIASVGREILNKISQGLKSLPADYRIVIEGYTDNEPIRYSGWKSNWELSTGRALSVLHYLVDKCGLDEDLFSVSGYGELKPVADNATEKGQRQNRRVEIVIQPPKIIKVKTSELTE